MATRDFLTPENLQIMLDETYGNQQTQDFIRPNPLQFQYPYIPGGIMNTGSVMYDEFPPGFNFTPQGPSQKFEFLPEAYNQSEDVEQVDSLTGKKKSNGIMDMFMSFLVPGYNFIKNLGGQPYEQFTPGGTIRNGIYSIDGVNVPVSSFGGDFYNPNTGLNRFDRAAERFKKTGSMLDLFASSRTGKEFFEKRREIQAQKQKDLEEAAKKKRQFKKDTSGGGGGGGRDNTGGDIGSKGAADRFSNTSGKGRTGY